MANIQPKKKLRIWQLIFASLLVLIFGTGCQLFERSISRIFGKEDAKQTKIPEIPRSAETLKLEILFVERPADDPLLGDNRLWEGVDEVGDLEPVVRKRLESNGLRVGLSSSTPNRAIETLLGLKVDNDGTASPVDARKLTGRRIVRPSGGETVVQVSKVISDARVSIVKEDGVRVKDFQQSRCVMRVKVERLQEGWGTLEFLPEIHHGRHGYRPMYSDNGLQGGTSQNIYRLYSLRFPMKLNVGEMVILTADRSKPNSLGSHFFSKGEGDNRIQRLLIIRLVDIKKSPVIRSSFNRSR